MMEVKDIWQPKKNEEAEMEQERQYQRDNMVTDNVTNPQNYDEQYIQDNKEKLADLRRWQQDLQPKFRRLFENLAGIRITEEGDIVKIPYVNPRVNLNGAYHIVNFLEVNDVNTIMSNYSEVGVKMALRLGIGYPLIQFIKDNYREFGIEPNYGNLRYINAIAFNTAEPTFNRAINAGERLHDSKIYKIVRTENALPKQEKKGLFPSKG